MTRSIRTIALPTFYEGEFVKVKNASYPSVYVITKVNPTKYVMTELATGKGGVTIAHEGVRKATDEEVAAAPPMPVRRDWLMGEIVRLSGRPGLFVVCVDKGERVNVAALGGQRGKNGLSTYVRAVESGLTLVDPSEILKDGAL